MTHKYTFPLTAFLLIVLLLGVLASFPPTIQAGPSLPPRNTPTPAPAGGKDHHKNDKPAGAFIDLEAATAPANAWVVVQWQDSAGGWHEVEGWRGSLLNSSRWWVHPKDFGTGPFRWLVTQGPDGPVLGVSEPFYLPDGANETLRVTTAPGAP